MGIDLSPTTDPRDVADIVFSRLRQRENLLVVIDNLDDSTVVDGLLPECSEQKHILITTRNPRVDEIPARGLAVPLFTSEEAMELLAKLSKIPVSSGSQEQRSAQQIVSELGYSPLAIDGAASYVREVTGDFATYQEEYAQMRKELHEWVPDGNRQYQHSVATAMSISLSSVEGTHPDAAKLFRILCFLNGDGTFIDFLHKGVDAFDEDLKRHKKPFLKQIHHIRS